MSLRCILVKKNQTQDNWKIGFWKSCTVGACPCIITVVRCVYDYFDTRHDRRVIVQSDHFTYGQNTRNTFSPPPHLALLNSKPLTTIDGLTYYNRYRQKPKTQKKKKHHA